MKLGKLLLPGLLLLLACQSPTKADNNLALAYLFGYGNQGGLGGVGVQSFTPAPPYFALHPPVYYGQRFTRPYGVSPFATWPQVQTNAAYAPQPHVNRAHVIANPYCTSCDLPVAGELTRVAPVEPLVIDNPYFKAAEVYTSSK